ncbi:metal-sensitive transcriptional regulator [Patescibacteria group bacterium]|nr:metal-sensitive transcriptional regulator [Patescibacteria group bacterium]
MEKNQNGIQHRLKIIEGHIKKVRKMVEDQQYCIDILNQSLAVQRALKEVDALILEKHLKSCVTDAIKHNKSAKSFKELLEVFKRANH